VFKETGENILADHFDLYLIFFSPFSLLFGTYTLLVIQVLFLLTGGTGVYACFRTNDKEPVAIYASLYYFLFFGVFAAVSSDYHSNVVAAGLVPWFFFLVQRKKIIRASVMLFIILVSKENISLWMAFVCLGLSVEFRKNPYLRNYLLPASVFCGLYFWLIISRVMPALANNGTYPHFDYGALGHNMTEAVWHLISRPAESFRILFINHTGVPGGDYVKPEFYLLLLLSGFPFLFRKPQYILMLVPVFFQKFFHDNVIMWGIGGQYSIEFAPVMAIGIFRVIAEIRKPVLVRIASVSVVVLTMAATLRTMDHTVEWTNKSQIRFYQAGHYKRDYDVKKVHELLSEIPENAAVSAQSPFLPHLALRDRIYQFPIIRDARYIIYSGKENSYPMTVDGFHSLTRELEHSKDWKILFRGDITVLYRENATLPGQARDPR